MVTRVRCLSRLLVFVVTIVAFVLPRASAFPLLLDEAIPETPRVVYVDCYNVEGRLLVPMPSMLSALSATQATPAGLAELQLVDVEGMAHVWLRPIAGLFGYGIQWLGDGLVQLTRPGSSLRVVTNVLTGESPPLDRAVAITFDDGPNPHCTPAILSVLASRGARATFFCIGQEALKYPQLTRQIAESGSEVANHSLSHRDLTALSGPALAEEIVSGRAVLEALSGTSVRHLRPPFGKTSDAVTTAAVGSDQTVVLWDVDPRDWESADVPTIVGRVLTKASAGDIILLHERAAAVMALPLILDGLKARGLEAVTLSELALRGAPGLREDWAPLVAKGIGIR